VSSTAVAVAAMDRPFILLLGGRHKGESYASLAPGLASRCRGVVAFGEAGRRIAADLSDRVPVVAAEGFDDVLATAAGMAWPGDAVLLSPACSSYDMFPNYIARGDRFRAFAERGA
jgi:UDP-N-acetylmuramoylalanine--D-glutamate ligase